MPQPTPSRWRAFGRYLLIALAVVVVDQVVKVVVKTQMTPGEAGEIQVLGSFFRIHFTENPGAAFGLTVGDLTRGWLHLSSAQSKLALTLFSLVAIGFIVGYLWSLAGKVRTSLPLWIALILGGALGNMIDRTFYAIWFKGINHYPHPWENAEGLFEGHVVDMFYIDIWKGVVPESVPLLGGQFLFLWPIFNVADMAISISVVVLFIFSKRLFPAPERPLYTNRDQLVNKPAQTAPNGHTGE